MFETIFDFWYDLPVLLRVLLSLALIAVTVVVYFLGRFWPFPGALGVVLLCFCGSGGNKGGYNF